MKFWLSSGALEAILLTVHFLQNDLETSEFITSSHCDSALHSHTVTPITRINFVMKHHATNLAHKLPATEMFPIEWPFCGRLTKSTQVFLDSPVAISATEVFRRHPECFEPAIAKLFQEGPDPFALPGLHFMRETAESIAINSVHRGAIIMAGSGMCTGGHVRHHLQHNVGASSFLERAFTPSISSKARDFSRASVIASQC